MWAIVTKCLFNYPGVPAPATRWKRSGNFLQIALTPSPHPLTSFFLAKLHSLCEASFLHSFVFFLSKLFIFFSFSKRKNLHFIHIQCPPQSIFRLCLCILLCTFSSGRHQLHLLAGTLPLPLHAEKNFS